MSQVPKFLLGGIQFRRNFLGANTIKTTSWGIFECTVKVAPIFLVIAYAGKYNCRFTLSGHHSNKYAQRQVLVEGAQPSAPVRRTSLTE